MCSNIFAHNGRQNPDRTDVQYVHYKRQLSPCNTHTGSLFSLLKMEMATLRRKTEFNMRPAFTAVHSRFANIFLFKVIDKTAKAFFIMPSGGKILVMFL